MREHKLNLGGVRVGQIDAAHIVDGYREQTLDLLWRVMMHFKIPALLDAGTLKAEINRISNEYARFDISEVCNTRPVSANTPSSVANISHR